MPTTISKTALRNKASPELDHSDCTSESHAGPISGGGGLPKAIQLARPSFVSLQPSVVSGEGIREIDILGSTGKLRQISQVVDAAFELWFVCCCWSTVSAVICSGIKGSLDAHQNFLFRRPAMTILL
jgi:hypothetical protein